MISDQRNQSARDCEGFRVQEALLIAIEWRLVKILALRIITLREHDEASDPRNIQPSDLAPLFLTLLGTLYLRLAFRMLRP